MKANEMSELLRKMAQLLDLYDDKNLSYVLDDLHKIKSNFGQAMKRQKGKRLTESGAGNDARIRDLAEWAVTANLPDVERKLTKDELFFDSENVRIFAKLVGVQTNARQNRDVCIQTVISHLDRARLHRVISARHQTNQDESPAEAPSIEIHGPKMATGVKDGDPPSASGKK
jgi:hypothetical protein